MARLSQYDQDSGVLGSIFGFLYLWKLSRRVGLKGLGFGVQELWFGAWDVGFGLLEFGFSFLVLPQQYVN